MTTPSCSFPSAEDDENLNSQLLNLLVVGDDNKDADDEKKNEASRERKATTDPIDDFIYVALQYHPALKHSKVKHSILRDVASQILCADVTNPLSWMNENARNRFASAIVNMGFDGIENESQRLARLEDAFNQHNEKNTATMTWDFHCLRVEEALTVLESNLQALNNIPGKKRILIITGRGIHGNNAYSVLEREISRRIQEMISKENSLVEEMRKERVGDMVVEIRSPNPFNS